MTDVWGSRYCVLKLTCTFEHNRVQSKAYIWTALGMQTSAKALAAGLEAETRQLS